MRWLLSEVLLYPNRVVRCTLIEYTCKYSYVKGTSLVEFSDILTFNKCKLSVTLYSCSFGVQCLKIYNSSNLSLEHVE